MKVQEIMVKEVKTCHPDTNLSEATQIMWATDCGALPVIRDGSEVVGMITDRDIAVAVGTRNRAPSDVTVFQVKPHPQDLFACAPEDDIHVALKTMRTQGVRRLPVISRGQLRGILCFNEIALSASKRGDISHDDVVETLKAVCEHRLARQIVAV